MTDFPSTTTDPALLAAMGQAARPKRVNQATRRRRRPSARRGRARRSFAGRLVRAIVGLFMMLASLWFLVTVMPVLLTALLTSLVDVGDPNAAPTNVAPTPVAPSAKPSGAAKAKPSPTGKASPTKAPVPKVTPRPTPVVPALPPTDCARATGAEVARVLGRTVQPVAVSAGCAWGTRLDDPSTVLVTIRMSLSGSVFDSKFQTSEKQRRVVFGTAYGPGYRPATALWVATGQPIGPGRGAVKAPADTHVVVSTTELGLTDDQARRKALAIAAALNN